jgi:hypothetical protein
MRIGGFRRRGAATATPTLEAVSNALQAAAMGMQGAEVAPTAVQVAAAAAARRQYVTTMGRWTLARTRAKALGVER